MVAAQALPVAASVLVGRAAEMHALLGELVDGDARLVTLTGPPGVGKTRLALGVAQAVVEAVAAGCAGGAGRFADGVVWVDLAPVRDPGAVVDEIAHAVGVASPEALLDRQLLVVLDNCEHLLAAAPVVAGLLTEHSGLRLLATSRERLRVAAERERPVTPLPPPDPDDVADLRRMAANPAVALVLNHAPAYVTLTARTAQPLADVCAQLDGLPLALEFAAARLRVFTPSELAFRLEHGMRELGSARRDAPDRHRDLRSAMVWSHDLLPSAERTLFRRLSVFEGSWTMGAVEAVCGGPEVPDVISTLESLLDKSLVRRVTADETLEARFSMLLSIREYAAEELAGHLDAEPTRRRHAAWFAQLACEWESTIGAPEEDMAMPGVTLVRADLEAALEIVRDDDHEAALWLAAALGWFWYTRGSPAFAREVVTVVDRDDSTADPAARTAAWAAAGGVALARRELPTAERHLLAAIAVAEASDDRRRLAYASAFLGHVAREQGEPDRATGLYRRARAIYEELGVVEGVAWAACDLGLITAEHGDAEPAEDLLREALMIFESLHYDWAVAVAACGLATVLVHTGATDEAATLAGRALGLHGHVGDLRGVAQSLEALAEVALVRGAAATSARLLGAADGQRERVSALLTQAERERVDRMAAALALGLGRTEAERERRAGRSAPAARSRELALSVAAAAEPATAVVGPALTGRQREVAELVAAGRTNRQIARELEISEKTAELHVRNAMQRLGVPNRAGIAAWVAGHPPATSP